MLLVIASRFDGSAPALIEQWQHLDARLVTCRDLSEPGWRYYPGNARDSRAVISGETVPFNRISGTLICTPYINETELVHIEPGDRSYVAAEMKAFLTAWLSEAPFPVVNRPTASCLMGPNWSQSRWVHEAARAGLRFRSAAQALSRREHLAEAVTGNAKVTVVGDRCFGDMAGLLTRQAKRLAAAARVQSLTVVFSGFEADAEFIQAYPAVDFSQTGVADAMADLFPATATAFA